MNRAGKYIKNLTGSISYQSYQPTKLPPNPEIKMTKEIIKELVSAHKNLTELDTIAKIIPDISNFIAMYIRKEAMISSQIEGTQCTIDDILDPNIESNVGQDVAEVLSYIKAIEFALEERKNLPLCNRFLRLVHKVLLDNSRGNTKEPGEFRRSQNWIGPAGCTLQNAKYIPPNVEDMKDAMSDLEKYINTEDTTDNLVKIALIHYQIETIHPFLDGNGRIGRLLILLCLLECKLLHEPILYVSYFLKNNQSEYYHRLSLVRTSGDYEQWILFFLSSIKNAAQDAIDTINSIQNLYKNNTKKISSLPHSVINLYNILYKRPIINIKSVQKILGVSRNTANNAILTLKNIGILEENTKKQRNKIYIYSEYINILRKD